MTRISIITATYNSEQTLPASIESLNQQDYTDVEHILVDGGSRDRTVELAKDSSRFLRHIVSEPDNGIYDALNKGIRMATGDLVGFLHSDDMLAASNTLAKIVKTVEHERLDAVYGDLRYVDRRDETKILRHWKSGPFSINKLKLGWMPPHPTFYVKRELYLKHGEFDTDFTISADYDLMLRYLRLAGTRVGYIPEVIVDMRSGGASNRSLANILRKSREDIEVLKRHGYRPLSTLALKNVRKIPQFLPFKRR
jgi:glycosyltransferase